MQLIKMDTNEKINISESEKQYYNAKWLEVPEELENQPIKLVNGLMMLDDVPIKVDLTAYTVTKKQQVAYGGYKFTKDNNDYICSTAEKDMGKVALTIQAVYSQPDTYTLTWQVYDLDGNRKYLTLTKAEFLKLITDAQNFVNEQFAIEAKFLTELATATITLDYITNFRKRVDAWGEG